MSFSPGRVALLYNEPAVSALVRKQRFDLADKFKSIGVQPYLKYLQYLQPQTGCFNACAFCAQDPGIYVWQFGKDDLYNVLSALKTVALEYEIEKGRVDAADLDYEGHWIADKPVGGLLGYSRAHRPGHIFPYLDDEPFSYPYLAEYLEVLWHDFGAQARLTTVTYSRKNLGLVNMHDRIARNLSDAIASLRISVTPYTLMWRRSAQDRLHDNDFALDLAHTLRQYMPYKASIGFAKNRYCIEMRAAPLIQRAHDFAERMIDGHLVIHVGNYTLVCTPPLSTLPLSRFDELVGSEGTATPTECILVITSGRPSFEQLVTHVLAEFHKKNIGPSLAALTLPDGTPIAVALRTLYRVSNIDGEYYSISGLPDDYGRRMEINLYPVTNSRKASGAIYRVRHFLNSLIDFKLQRGVTRIDAVPDATWEDADYVLELMNNDARFFDAISPDLATYIRAEQLPLAALIVFAMKLAGYTADDFFSYGFVWDTGTITNLGRALKTVFHDFVSAWYQPLSLNEEKGYGYSSLSESGKRDAVLRIAPTPALQPEPLHMSMLGFRSPLAIPGGGVTVELLDQHIQPIKSYSHRIPGVSVQLLRWNDKIGSALLPGA